MMTDCASSHCSNHEDGDDRVAAQPVSAGRVWSRALIIFVFALFLRLAYLYQVWGVPFMHFPSVDARRYDEWGQAIARGDWWGNEVFYQAPLYPYLVGAVYAVFGRSLPALHVIQMLIGAGTCALAYLAGRRYFGERAGLLSGALLTIYSPAIFFDGIMHKEGLALFLLMLVVYLLGRTLDGADRRTFIVAGLATGLLALTR
jgi:4-amino-4-deoxy-L-arabinose transferase-like glycosyltransferase